MIMSGRDGWRVNCFCIPIFQPGGVVGNFYNDSLAELHHPGPRYTLALAAVWVC